MNGYFTKLAARRVLHVGGAQAIGFLQGLVSNDVTRAQGNQAVFAALLTPQGKFLHDFFIVQAPDGLFLETDGDGLEGLKKRLSLYRLRSAVTLEPAGDALNVWAIWGGDTGPALTLSGATAYDDPRLAAMGARLITNDNPAPGLRAAGFEENGFERYEHLRLQHAIPEGCIDLKPERSALLESNYDALNAIAWDKGCYMGQELTARTRYRGLVKRRLTGIRYAGDALAPDSTLLADGRAVGEVRSARDGLGIASLRLDTLDETGQASLTAQDGRPVTAQLPGYIRPL